MLRANLIRQQLEADTERRIAWLIAGGVSAVCAVAVAVAVACMFVGIARVETDIERTTARTSEARAAANDVATVKHRAAELQPLSDLAGSVRDTASGWGRLLKDLDRAAPRSGGVWLTSVETRYDQAEHRQTVTIRGSAQHASQVSDFQTDLRRLDERFDPSRIVLRSAESHIDEKTKTQWVDFAIEAALKEPIGVEFQ
jgi:Tfp pilus assembly protein PilN